MRLTGKLSAKKVAKLLSRGEPGNWHDGQGLRLEIRSANSGSWVSRYELNGRERWMGIGPARLFTLAEARERNRRARQKLVDGIDPLDERRAERAAALAAAKRTVTFAEAAAAYLIDNAGKWTNAKHAAQWASSLKTYAEPILGRMPVADITIPDILRVLEQHIDAAPAGKFWDVRRETASRTRGRVETVLNWAAARGYRDGANPATWDVIGEALPGRSARTVKHLAAMPHVEVPALLAALGAREGIAARALAFTALTACRSGEVLGARWSEINFDAKTWTIPSVGMKSGRQHVVPLAKPVLDLLRALPQETGDGGYVFIGRRAGRGLAHTALSEELARSGHAGTVHGLRSAFSSWASERGFASDDIELCLAHSIGSQAERSYKRTTLIDRRGRLMDAWAAFCMTAPVAAAGSNVVGFGR
jgi:integrase